MSKKNHFLLGFILGGASALAATYLLTPQTTDELRKKLKSGTNELSDRAADYFDFAKDATEDFRTSAEEFVTGLKTKITPSEDGDISAFTDATAAIRTKLGAVANHDAEDDDFDDIIVDGKSAFGQAKDAPADTVTSDAATSEADPTDSAADDVEQPAASSADDNTSVHTPDAPNDKDAE